MEIELPGFIYIISKANLLDIIMFLIIWCVSLGLGVWKYYDIKN